MHSSASLRKKLRYVLLVLLFWACCGRTLCLGQSQRSDTIALTAIFGSESLRNTLAFCEGLDGLPASTQYERLRDNVFPPGTSSIRMEYASAPRSWPRPQSAHLATPYPTFDAQDGPWVESPFSPPVLLVPAVSLIDMAAQLGRLPEIETLLKDRVVNAANSEADVLILRSLLAIAHGRLDEASEHMFALSAVLETKQLVERAIGGILALIWKASPIAALREASMSLAMHCYELARVGGSPLEELWKRHSFATHYRLQSIAADHDAVDSSQPAESDARWRPVSRITPQSNGQGFPAAVWRLSPGQASKVVSSDRDFLYFDVPLTGDFAVEAMVSAFGYRETRLGYGGTWAGPTYDLKTLVRGHYARDQSALILSPPLDEIANSMRVRLEVQDGTSTTYVNGREVNQAAVSASDPWLTIFSDWFTHGWVKNLRILGNPQIPASIDLLADERLLGWDAFYGTFVGEETDWELVKATNPSEAEKAPAFVLRGKRQDLVSGSYCERLLRYHRPVFEDAALSYEFFYRAGSHGVHPAIGGNAYVLNADAEIVVHPMTDGIYERTQKRPQPLRPPPSFQQTFSAPALRSDDWNRMDIQIYGDHIQLALNGQPIYEASLEQKSPRVFGLFHYCDQTEALVRNLRWTGDWPKTLDAVKPQELADQTLDQILAGPELEQTFRHSFAEGLPLENFAISGEGWKENLTQDENGLRLTRPGGNFVRYTIVPNLQIAGDFDVIAEFEGFEATIASGGDANIQLVLGFSQHAADYRLYRKFSRFAKKELGQQMIQAAYFYTRGGHRSYEFPKLTSEAATGGKLRFVRRGDRLHYLFAAKESEYYRLLHSEAVPVEATRPNGIELCIETTKAGEATVVWKSLEVRAEQLFGKAMETSLSVEQLNESRQALPRTVTLDFAEANVRQRVQTWGTDTTFRNVAEGLLVMAPGFQDWHGHGLYPRLSVHGDFDIQLELQVQHIELPQAGGESVVYLDTEFQGQLKTSIHNKFAISPSGVKTAELAHCVTADNGDLDYKELVNYPLESVHALRIARRDDTAYVLVQETPTSKPLVLGRVKVEDVPVAVGNLRAVLHTAGIGRKTVALFKRLTVHAEAIQE